MQRLYVSSQIIGPCMSPREAIQLQTHSSHPRRVQHCSVTEQQAHAGMALQPEVTASHMLWCHTTTCTPNLCVSKCTGAWTTRQFPHLNLLTDHQEYRPALCLPLHLPAAMHSIRHQRGSAEQLSLRMTTALRLARPAACKGRAALRLSLAAASMMSASWVAWGCTG